MRHPRLPVLLGGVALLAYAAVLFQHVSFAAGGSDSSGYLNGARLLSEGRVTSRIRGLDRLGLPPELDRVFIPLGFSPGPRPGTMSPSYPPGLSLHMAVAGRLGGWERAPFLVTPLAGLACLVLIYLLGRELGLSPALSLAGSALLGFAPVFVFEEVVPMSDVPATAWAMAAVLAAYRARKNGAWSVAAGAALAVAVLVRPMNALLIPALLLVLPLRRKELARFLLGGAPFAAFLLLYNRAAFGSPWRTGYGSLLAESLAWNHFGPRAIYYTFSLAATMSPILLAGWVALLADRRVAARDRAILFLWFGAFFLFYCFYAVYDAWWYTRFLLPGLPAIILGTLLCIRDFVLAPDGRGKRFRVAVAGFLILAALAVEVRFIEEHRPHKIGRGERIYPEACRMARRRLPPNAIVLSMQMSGALHYYTDLTYAMWNWLLPERFEELRARTERRGYRWFALLNPDERKEVRKSFPGDWQAVDRSGDVVLLELSPVAR